MTKFKPVSMADFDQIKENAKILLITATNVESSAIHACLRPMKPRGRCSTIIVANQTYYVGRLGNYGVIHVQCQMGSVSPGASETTAAEAIALWGVKAVIMVGIAFGVDRTKQRIGDVFVSKTVIPYEIKRIGRKVVQRGPIPPCGSMLLNRFSNCRHWHYGLSRDQQARLFPAHILSGESLIDNKYYRNKLLAEFPQAEGGEMEGVGVFAAAHQKGIEWILVKGICDFADGKKSIGKKSKQIIAAKSAASLCKHVFSQLGTFESFGCIDLSLETIQDSADNLTTHEVLFEVYDFAYECAYLERSIDRNIKTIIDHQGLWVTGPSGCGKTSALRRNLAKAGKTFEFIDMSRCIGATVPELFAELHSEIAQRLNIPDSEHQTPRNGNGQSFHIGEIARLTQRNIGNSTSLIIDEIPLDACDFPAFSEGIAALVITMANSGLPRTPIMLASISDPTTGLRHFHRKFYDHVRILYLPMWTDEEIKELLELIAKLLPLGLSKSDKAKIARAAKGCPRVLKSILKTWCMFRKSDGWTLDKIISESCCI